MEHISCRDIGRFAMLKGPFHIVAEPVSQSRMAHSVIPGTKVAYGDRAWWLFSVLPEY